MSQLNNDKRSTTPEAAQRNQAQMSKSEITYDSRMAQLKASQSPHKENLAMEVSKLTENSKKMLDLIEQMTKKEETKNKQISSQNQIIQDLKQKLEALAGQQSDKQEQQDGSTGIEGESQETQLYLALLNELRIKQDDIDALTVKTAKMEETIKEIENSQKINLLLSAEKQTVQDNDINFVHQEKKSTDQSVDQSTEQNVRLEDQQHQQMLLLELQDKLTRNSSSVDELKEAADNVTHKIQELTEMVDNVKQQINEIQSKPEIQQNAGEEQKEGEDRQGNSDMEERIKLMDESIVALQAKIQELKDQEQARLDSSLQESSCDECEANQEKKGSVILNFFKELFLLIGAALFIFVVKELTYKK